MLGQLHKLAAHFAALLAAHLKVQLVAVVTAYFGYKAGGTTTSTSEGESGSVLCWLQNVLYSDSYVMFPVSCTVSCTTVCTPDR